MTKNPYDEVDIQNYLRIIRNHREEIDRHNKAIKRWLVKIKQIRKKEVFRNGNNKPK